MNFKTDKKILALRFAFILIALFIVLNRARAWFFSPAVPTSPVSVQKDNTTVKIDWQDAANHIGEYVQVDGKVLSAYNSGKVCLLNFHKDYKRYITIVIFPDKYYLFSSEPEKYFLNKQIRVTGQIKEYKGRPEIVVNEKSQLEVM
jgi:micrococcal nuclease